MIGTGLLWALIAALFAAFGAISGWLLGLSGFVEVAKGTDLKQSLRLKNFQYLVGGAAAAFALDYRKAGLGESFPSYLPTLSFAAGALTAYLATVRNVRASIRRSVELWNRDCGSPAAQIDVNAMLRLYDERGRPAFETRFGELCEQGKQAHRREMDHRAELARTTGESERVARRARYIEANRAISRCVYAVLSYRERVESEEERKRRSELVESILQAACAAVRAHGPRPDTIVLNGSFMRFVPDARATPETRTAALFTFDHPTSQIPATHPGRYKGFLELRHGADYSAGNRVWLPVESAAAADKRLGLPGAPEAARANGIAIMNVRPTDRSGGIPRRVWDDIDDFFKDAGFRSIASVCINDASGVLGVLNIESSEPNLLGGDGSEMDAPTAACATLQPVAALLSRFV